MRQAVVSRGHLISYRTEGDGAPLVLLCGFSQWADQWWDAGYVRQLTDRYRVIAIDRLGHGSSDKPHDPSAYRERDIVADIVAVLDEEAVDSAAIWGFSLGAKNAASLAALEGDRVGVLVYGSGFALEAPNDPDDSILALESDAELVQLWASLGFTDPDAVADALSRNDLIALRATSVGQADYWPLASDITAPSLWYVGGMEPAFSEDQTAFAASRGIPLHVVPDADHVAAFFRSADVLGFVRPFLDLHTS